jgi:thioredoxin 2
MIRVCPSCGKKNRIPAEHLTDEARCGACKAALPPLVDPVDADPSLFDEIVRGARVPVLVDFWAAWCGPCRMAAPEVERTARSMAGRAVVLKVDTEAHPQVAARYGVQAIPNFVVLRNGQVVMQQPGFARQGQMEEWLARAGALPSRPAAG